MISCVKNETILINKHLRHILNIAVSSHCGDESVKCTEDKCRWINNKKIS